ncbi:MAG: efflux RND transporter periplasmic adaptor subunit [Massilia sp.]|nr:efflux RND transporter periplasmic adaptor subunit [Massilia sp.]
MLLTLMLLPLAACHRSDAGAASSAPVGPMLVRQGNNIVIPAASPLRARLRVAAVDAAPSAHTLSLPGVVEADPATTVNIVAPLTGRLVALNVRLGDTVKRGQALALIGAPDLAQAFADADKAHDARDLASRAVARARGVNEAGANAGKDVEQANSTLVQAQAESLRADARLSALGADTAGKSRQLTLRSPVAGTVTALNSGAGAFLNDPTAVLMTISNLDQVWVAAYVPENLVASVRKGQPADVTLTAYPDQVRHGTIGFIGAVLEADTRRDKARIAFANLDGALKPNMYASVRVSVAQPAGLRVPLSALLMNNDSTSVFVEVAPWTFVRRFVDIGAEDGEMVRVVAGLRSGERVLVSGGVLLND